MCNNEGHIARVCRRTTDGCDYGKPGRNSLTTLVLAGFAGDICVLYTANDAYMRDFQIVAAADCIASKSEAANRAALEHMGDRLKAAYARRGILAESTRGIGAEVQRVLPET